jgi:hypothetical protein
MIDLIVPSLSQYQAQRLLYSLSLGSVKPARVSFISNELSGRMETHGNNVRIIRFSSDYYPIGDKDVALRCNIGWYFSEHLAMMYAGEDQIASVSVIEDGINLLRTNPFYWGHHRYIEFSDKKVKEIVSLSPNVGRSRENGVNRLHTFRSAYSGSFGIRREAMENVGGFDMAFSCRHAGEDQQLGKRLSKNGEIFIHEPPFWWHSTRGEGWGDHAYSNVCGYHGDLKQYGDYIRCDMCPYYKYVGDEDQLFNTRLPLLRFNPDKVNIEVEYIKDTILEGLHV